MRPVGTVRCMHGRHGAPSPAWVSKNGANSERQARRSYRYSFSNHHFLVGVAGPDLNKLLHALPFISFRDEEVAFRVYGEVVRAVELSCPVAGSAKRAKNVQRLPIEDIDLLVGSVDHERKLLLWID